MGLSKKQTEVAKKMVMLAKTGDSGAIKFFEDVAKQGGQMAADYKAIYDGQSTTSAGRKAYLDADTSLLNPKQLQVAIEQALKKKDGDEGAIRFYASQVAESGRTDRPNPMAKQYLAVMDEVIKKDSLGINVFRAPDQKEPPTPPTVAP
jgi:hypothetical protein